MSLFLRQIARYAAQRLAADPQARDKAVKTARVLVDEAKIIARDEDRARAAGRATRRAIDKLRGNREDG